MPPNRTNPNPEQDELALLRRMGARPSSLAAIEQRRRPWWRKRRVLIDVALGSLLVSVLTLYLLQILQSSSAATLKTIHLSMEPSASVPISLTNGSALQYRLRVDLDYGTNQQNENLPPQGAGVASMQFDGTGAVKAALDPNPVNANSRVSLTISSENEHAFYLYVPLPATPMANEAVHPTVDATATAEAAATQMSIAVSGTVSAKLLAQVPEQVPTRISPTPTSPSPTSTPTPTPTSPQLTMRVSDGPTTAVKLSDEITFEVAVTKTGEMANGALLKCNPGNLGEITTAKLLPIGATETELTYSLDGLNPGESATYTMTVKVGPSVGESNNPECYIEHNGRQQPAIANFQITRRRLPTLTPKFAPLAVDIGIGDQVTVSFTLTTTDSSPLSAIPISISVTSSVTNLVSLTGTESSQIIEAGISYSLPFTATSIGTGALVVATLEGSQRFTQTIVVRPVVVIVSSYLNIRKTPVDGNPIVQAANGEKLLILGRNAKTAWWYVQRQDRITKGWISGGADWVSVQGRTDDIPEVDNTGIPVPTQTATP